MDVQAFLAADTLIWNVEQLHFIPIIDEGFEAAAKETSGCLMWPLRSAESFQT